MAKVSVSAAKRQHERALRNKKYDKQKKLTSGTGKKRIVPKGLAAKRAKTPAVAKPGGTRAAIEASAKAKARKSKALLDKHYAQKDAKAKKEKAEVMKREKARKSRTAQLKKHFKGMFSGKSGKKLQGKR